METLVEEQKRSALDLYGGEEVVIGRMNSLVKEELTKKFIVHKKECKSFLDNIIFETGVPEQQIFGISSGATKVNYKLFELVGGYLGVEINDVLGEPVFSNEKIRNYWINQLHENPMVIGGTHPKDISGFRDMELKFYVKLTAIAELIKDYNKSEQSLAVAT